MAKNSEVLKDFMNKGEGLQSTSLRSFDNKLVSFNTTIGQFTADGRVIINVTKYSVTTSKIQNALLREVSKKGLSTISVNGVPRNVHDLAPYIK